MSDEEYFWEPVAGCWSLRVDPDGNMRTDASRLLPPERHPFTTLAWRLWHLIGCYGGARNGLWLGVRPTNGEFDAFAPAPRTAAAALAALDTAYAWWEAALRSLTDEQLVEVLGPRAGTYSEHSKASFVLHQLDEIIHHGAEVALMRDLYRDRVARRREEPRSVVEAAAGGYWAEVRALVAAGGDVKATLPDDFERTPLHYAAAAAPPDVVQMLLDHGADASARDRQFDATPLGWADYFGRDDVVSLLS